MTRCPVDVHCGSDLKQDTYGIPGAFGDGPLAGVFPVEGQDFCSGLAVTEYLHETALHGRDVLYHEFQGNEYGNQFP